MLLIFSFQNCQKAALVANDASGTPAVSNDVSYEKAAVNPLTVFQMWDYQSGKTYDLDVNTGRIQAYNDFGSTPMGESCLNGELRLELEAILNNSEVCAPQYPVGYFQDRICTQNYRYPYAVLIQGSERIPLGELTSGCDVATDLCGDKAQTLQKYVQKVLPLIPQMSCN